MQWEKGFTARYTGAIVDPSTWRDTRHFDIVSGTIDKSDSELKVSADIELTEYIGEQWIRIYLDARQEGEAAERVPLFTGLTSAPERALDGNRITYSVECYSVLKPADDVLLQRGYYAPSGVNGAELAAKLISVINMPITIGTNSPKLQESIVADDGETQLSMAEKIITAIGWKLVVYGDGTVYIGSNSDEEVARFNPTTNDVIEMSVKDTADWFSCPNVFRAVSGDTVAVARDDSDGELSTVTRGREIWMEELSVDLNDGESLADYALRRLKEEQTVSRTLSYTRRFSPNIQIGDVVRMSYSNISGCYRVTSQKITLGFGGRTEEEAQICL